MNRPRLPVHVIHQQILPERRSFTLQFTPGSLRDFGRLDATIRRKVLLDIEKLQDNPRPHGIEKLETREKLYRIYVGPGKNYRVAQWLQ
jgi:mRNA-degrading endonuclease RelE of RelBE toxin-antitoxin system